MIVIGGGVIGLSIARELRKRGVGRVRILEKGQIGREASWAAAGILAPQAEADGAGEFFKLCYESNRMFPAFAAELLDETGIDIELDQRGTLYVGFDENDAAAFERRYAWQEAAGLSLLRLDGSEIKDLEPNLSPAVTCGVLFPDDGQVENRKMVEALAAFAKANEIEVEEGNTVENIIVEGDRVTGVETTAGRLPAENVVIASGAWTSHIKLANGALPIKVKPIRGQMISYRPNVTFDRVVFSRRGYLVPRADGRLLVGATVEDVGFDTSVTSEGIADLKKIGAELAPFLHNGEITEEWAGLRPYSAAEMPTIGVVAGVKGLYAATGHFRNGILLAPLTARKIADEIACKGG